MSCTKQIIKLGLSCLLTLALATECIAQSSGDEIELSDSLFLLRNILKDIEKEKKLQEQYTLFLRADSIYDQIKESLSVKETKELRKQLSIIFRNLPAPEEVFTEEGLRFTLKYGEPDLYFWSDPVPERMFVDYLNAVNFPVSEISERLAKNSHTITFDKEVLKYKSLNPRKPYNGR